MQTFTQAAVSASPYRLTVTHALCRDKKAEGAYGAIFGLPLFPPGIDNDGKFHDTAVAKSTKLAGSQQHHVVDDAQAASAAAPAEVEDDAEVKALTSEIRTLRRLRHKHVVTTFGFTYGKPPGASQPSYLLLLERCDGDLGNLIYPQDTKEKLAPAAIMQMTTEMAAALAFLHSHGVKHLDMCV